METDHDFGGDDWHGSDGPIPVRRAPRSLWLPHSVAFERVCIAEGFPVDADQNHPESTGVSPRARNTVGGVRMSMAINYLDPARHRLNLTIRANVTVRRVLFDCGSTSSPRAVGGSPRAETSLPRAATGLPRAVGVEVESGGEVFKVAGREIILSAGAVASPQLLMLSGVGPAEPLAELGIPVVRDLPGVGRNLRDHPTAAVLYRAKGEKPDVHAPVTQVGLRYTVPGSGLRNDMQISPMLMTSEHWPAHIPIDDGLNYMGIGASLQLALGQGELTLQSADPRAQPRLDFNYYREAEDLRRMREAIRLCVRLAERPPFSDLLLERVMPTDAELASDDLLDDWLRRTSDTSHHISGTCKMGPDSDPMAVVDQYLNVKGVAGLRVADASIMPDCIRANTNATAIMIGERAADFVRTGR